MIMKPLTTVVHNLRRAEAIPDGPLLRAFINERDESAFTMLVQRHAAMVLGVCRRVLGDGPDAEDAMQAAFLVMARKANTVKPPDLVGNWLYGVAYRTAMALRTRILRTRAHEKQVMEMPHPTIETKSDLQELRQILDQELSRLPDKYRAAVVLCELEGRSRKEASSLLHIAEGTLSSRLAAARKMLAVRFRKLGWALPAVPIATLFSESSAPAAVSRQLFTAAANAAAGASGVSENVATLAEGVIQTMLFDKLKMLAVYACAVLLIAGGATFTVLMAFGPAQTVTNQNTQTSQNRNSNTNQVTVQAGEKANQGNAAEAKPVPLDAFREIHLKQGSALIRQTGKETVRFENNTIPDAEEHAKVTDGVLTLRGTTPATNFIVEVKKLTRLQIDGVGKVKIEDAKGKKLQLLVLGPAKVEVDGTVDEQIIEAAAGADVHAQNCRAKQAEAKVLAGGKAIVYASDKLRATVAAGGRLEYLGSPNIEKNVSLGGTLVPYIPPPYIAAKKEKLKDPPVAKRPPFDQPPANAVVTLTATVDGYTQAVMFNPQKYPFKYIGKSSLDAGQFASLSKPGEISEGTAKALLGCLLWPKQGDKLGKTVLKSDGKKLTGEVEVVHNYGKQGTHILKMKIEGTVDERRIKLKAVQPGVSGSWNFGGGGSMKLKGDVKILISVK